jgi:hypothetical protein
MSTVTKLTAEQKGVLLQELISVLLQKNGKAKKDDVVEHFLKRLPELNMKLHVNETVEQIEFLASMCVKAEWLKRSGFWKTTQYGKKAYERFNSPKELFQEMAIQSVFRSTPSSQKEKRTSKIRAIALSLVISPCVLIGFLSGDQNLLYLAIIAVVVLLISIICYDSRTSLIIYGRVSMIEFLVLCFTFILDATFINTSLGMYFPQYFLVTLVFQTACIAGAFAFPRISSKAFEYINQSKWLIIGPILVLIFLFGGRLGKGGFLETFYGKNISQVSYTIVFAGLIGIGLIYIFGGIVSNLVRVGYYD